MVSESEGEAGREVEGGAGEPTLPAQPVIQRFGGIRPMAQKLGVPVSTVQGWKERGVIPANRREEVLAAAARHGIAWEPGDLAVPSSPPVIDLPGERVDGERSEPAEPAAPVKGEDQSRSTRWSGVRGEVSEAERSPERPVAAAPAAARPRSALVPAVLVSALVALAISGTAPWWTRAAGLIPSVQPAGDGESADRLAALDSRIAELERGAEAAPAPAQDGDLRARTEALEELTDRLRGEIDRLASAAPSAGPADAQGGARLEALSRELAELREELERIRRDGAQAVAPERLAALFDRIEENAAELRAMQGELSRLIELPRHVEELAGAIEAASGQTQRTAFILASGQLEAALDSGQPYASELGAVRRLAADDPELPALLAKLEEHADEGIPSLAELRLRFADTALAAAQAAQSEVSGDWMDRAWARLRSLVTVRPVGGDVAGDSAEARIARAEARLGEGDLAGAIAELEALEGAAAEAAAPWLAGARARLAADQAIERLRARALARVLPDGALE